MIPTRGRPAAVRILRRVEINVIVVLVLHANAPAGEPAHRVLFGYLDQQRGRQVPAKASKLGVKRLFLQESIAESFVGKLAEILKSKTVGNGINKESRMGPIHLDSQRKEIEEQVEDAKARGAKVVFGGERPKGGDLNKGFYYLPTLLTNVPDDARVSVEETFGPVLPVFTFKSLDEAIAKANSSIYGLGSSIWTRNLTHANKSMFFQFLHDIRIIIYPQMFGKIQRAI